MSDESTTSPLTRLVPGLTIIALLIIIAAAIFHVVTLDSGPVPTFSRDTAPEEPDFSAETGWLLAPEDRPEGGWEKPWGVDLIWFSRSVDSYRSGWNAPIDWVGTNETALQGDDWLRTVAESYPVYAPRRRFTSDLGGPEEDRNAALALELEDVRGATDLYLTSENQQRGFFLGGRGEGVALALKAYEERVAETAPYDELFGGFIVSEPNLDLSELPFSPCGSGEDTFPCILDLSDTDPAAAAEEVQAVMDGFSVWLGDNVTKPAAPLPPVETIDIAPINRPDE